MRDPKTWIKHNVAQFRYNLEKNEWTLYWRDRNQKWHLYADLLPTKKFDELLEELENDPTGIFRG